MIHGWDGLRVTGVGLSEKDRVVLSAYPGERMRALDGGGDAKQANVFVLVEPGEDRGLDARDDLYCAASAADARFGYAGDLLDFDAWVAAAGTDATSMALPASDAQCKAF